MTRWPPPPQRLTVVGLDLAWAEHNPSGASVATWNGSYATLAMETTGMLGDNADVLDFVRKATGDGPAVVAVDCPLAVPNPRGRRPCDDWISRLFRRFEAGVYPANRALYVRTKRLRGERLARTLARLPERRRFSPDPRVWARRSVIEVYPHAALVSLFHLDRTLKYKARPGRSIEERRAALGALQGLLLSLAKADPPFLVDDPSVDRATGSLSGGAFKEVEDRLDSLVCAYVGLVYGLYGPTRSAVFGTRRHGHIVVPMDDRMWEVLGRPDTPDIVYRGDTRQILK